jgi:hypothetical protein
MGKCYSCIKSQVQHFKPRREKKMMASEQQCDLCPHVGWDVKYCSFCKHWLCDRCRADPVKRVKGAFKEKILRKKKLY